MERGPGSVVAVPLNTVPVQEDVDDDEDSDDDYPDKFYAQNNLRKSGEYNRSGYGKPMNGNGFQRMSKTVTPSPPVASEFDEFSTPSPNPGPKTFGGIKNFKEGYMGRFGIGKNGARSEGNAKRGESDGGAELVKAIKGLGEGFMRIERMKMETAREVEAMRMDMEVKRTEMILESQRRIVESFVKAISERENKKAKRMPPSPEA